MLVMLVSRYNFFPFLDCPSYPVLHCWLPCGVNEDSPSPARPSMHALSLSTKCGKGGDATSERKLRRPLSSFLVYLALELAPDRA